MAAPRFSGLGAALRAPRPTSVGPRAYRGQVIALEVRGLRESARIPDGLRSAYLGMLSRLEKALVANYRAYVPGSPTGRLGSQVVATRPGRNTIVVGTVNSKFAKALNRGFTSKAASTGGQALRFSPSGGGGPGGFMFRRVVHVQGRHFHEKAIASTPAIVEAIYDDFFHDPRELRFG